MAARGNRKRAFWAGLVGCLLVAGGILSSLGVRSQYEDRIAERLQAEAAAARAGRPMPPGPTAALLNKEIRIIPYLLHLFTFGGFILLGISAGETRGWRAFDPVAEQPPPPKVP